MRFVIFCILLFIQTSLSGQSLLQQELDFEAIDLPVADALLQLSEKMDCSIYFNSQYFTEEQRITINIKNSPFHLVLKKCLAQTGFDFKLENNSIRLFALPPPTYTISGFIEDSLSGERLVSAIIYDQKTGKGTVSNEYGFYSLSVPKGEAVLNFSYLGFQSKDYHLSIRKDFHFTISLNVAVTLNEVIVIDRKMLPSTNREAITTSTELSPNTIDKFPRIGGEADVFHYLQNLAGVQSGTAGLGGMNVRGGDDNQNLVLLDGVPVYNPTHTLGLFSIFNTQTIKKATLHKSYFPAQYSGRLSSVLDVRTREGDAKEFHGGINISLLATSIFAEGPIKKDKTSFLLSVRRTHLDPLINFATQLGLNTETFTFKNAYFFYDTTLKLNHTFSAKDRIYLSVYKGRDHINFAKEMQDTSLVYSGPLFGEGLEFSGVSLTDYTNFNWGNSIFSLRWNHLWNKHLFSNTTFTYSRFDFQNSFITEEKFETTDLFEGVGRFSAISFQLASSSIEDAGLKIDLDYYPNNQHKIKFGAGLLIRHFTPSLVSKQIEEDLDSEFNIKDIEIPDTLSNATFLATELNLYGTDDFQISDKLKAQIGLHGVLFIAPNKLYPSLQPRLSFLYQINSKGHLTASLNSMSQFLHVLQSSSTGIPNDLWVPSTKKVKPQQSWQGNLGVSWQLFKDIEWDMEVYYKKLNRLVVYKDETNFLENTTEVFDWEEEIAKGEGWAYGLETSLQRTVGKTTGWLNYSLAWSERHFEGINNNQRFHFRYNQQHSIKFGLNHQFGPKFNLFATWKYGSGQRVTLLKLDSVGDLSEPDILQPFTVDPTVPINNHRLKPFHRLDISANFKKKKNNRIRELSIGINNVYGRKNILFAYQDQSSEDNEIEEISLGLVLPSIRYSLEF